MVYNWCAALGKKYLFSQEKSRKCTTIIFVSRDVLQLSMDSPDINLDVFKQYHQNTAESKHPVN